MTVDIVCCKVEGNIMQKVVMLSVMVPFTNRTQRMDKG